MAIHLKIKYFVPFDQLMGKTETLAVGEGTTIQGLIEMLSRKYSGFNQTNLRNQLVILINGVLCSPGGTLSDRDEISILTPLVGG